MRPAGSENTHFLKSENSLISFKHIHNELWPLLTPVPVNDLQERTKRPQGAAPQSSFLFIKLVEIN